MKTKVCIQCNTKKIITEFYKNSLTADGYFNVCKSCRYKQSQKWQKTKKGVAYTMYVSEIEGSKKRGHKPPNYSKEELCKWIFNNPKFDQLYNDWVDSGYDRWKKPSIDRIDNFKGYSFDNIQLVTWKENHTNHKEDVKNGVDNRLSKSVIQFDKNGKILNKFYSLHQAERETNIDRRDIRRACLGHRVFVGGFKWGYA